MYFKGEPTAPYFSVNKDKKYDFHLVLIPAPDEDIELSDVNLEFLTQLNGFSENEYIFQTYLKFYSYYLSRARTIITEYKNITYDEFKERVFSSFGVKIEDEWYIRLDTIPMIDGVLVTNERIIDDIAAMEQDYDTMFNFFLPSIMDTYVLFELLKDERLVSQCPNLMKLLYKITKVYIPLIHIMDVIGEYCGEGSAFMEMPDSYKVELTKNADFPKPLETIEYYDIVNEDYIVLYMLMNNFNYSGSPEDG